MRLLTFAFLALCLPACGADEGATGIGDISEVDRIAYSISTIIVQTGESNRTDGAARARAWELWELIRSGKPFAQVAAQNSDDDSKIDGGFMGFLPTRHDTALAGAIQSLRPGQLSPPIRTRIGYQVLYRHPFEEAVRLEREKWVAIFGVYFKWDGAPQGKERARDLAERVLAQLKAGEITLSEAVQTYAKDMKIASNGYLGATANRPARQVLWDAVSPLKEGEYTGPIETQYGWAVLRRGQYLRAVVKHILIQDSSHELSIPRTPMESKAIAERLSRDLDVDPSRWSRFVKNHSDDANTRGDDGMLETITTGTMPKAFEDLVRETKPGQIGARPVQTQYGWHIIWRIK